MVVLHWIFIFVLASYLAEFEKRTRRDKDLKHLYGVIWPYLVVFLIFISCMSCYLGLDVPISNNTKFGKCMSFMIFVYIVQIVDTKDYFKIFANILVSEAITTLHVRFIRSRKNGIDVIMLILIHLVF